MIYNIIKRRHKKVKQVILKDRKLYDINNNEEETSIYKNSVILILSFNNFYAIKEKLKCINISSEKIIKIWDIINDEKKISYFKNLSLNLEYCITKSKYEKESYFIVSSKMAFAFQNIFESINTKAKKVIKYDFLFCMYFNDKYYKFY